MREFNTAVEDLETDLVDAEGDLIYPYDIKVDGVVCSYRKPADGEYSVLLASLGRFTSIGDKIGAATSTFAEVFDEESQAHLVNRLLDPRDPFGFKQVVELFEVMVEEWSGRPTPRSSGSTPRRPKTGSGSKQSTRR